MMSIKDRIRKLSSQLILLAYFDFPSPADLEPSRSVNRYVYLHRHSSAMFRLLAEHRRGTLPLRGRTLRTRIAPCVDEVVLTLHRIGEMAFLDVAVAANVLGHAGDVDCERVILTIQTGNQ